MFQHSLRSRRRKKRSLNKSHRIKVVREIYRLGKINLETRKSKLKLNGEMSEQREMNVQKEIIVEIEVKFLVVDMVETKINSLEDQSAPLKKIQISNYKRN